MASFSWSLTSICGRQTSDKQISKTYSESVYLKINKEKIIASLQFHIRWSTKVLLKRYVRKCLKRIFISPKKQQSYRCNIHTIQKNICAQELGVLRTREVHRFKGNFSIDIKVQTKESFMCLS
jgi:hypothetical protein